MKHAFSVLNLLLVLSINQVQAQTKIQGLKEINGTNLFIREVGKGEPLIIIHGGPGLNHSYFLPYLDALANSFSVVYYDQRACGQSAIPAVDSLSLSFFIDDIEGIRKSLGVEKVNILAHSWGALLAVNYGIKYPQHVKKMMLSNPVQLNNEPTFEMAAKEINKQDSVDRAQILASKEFKNKDVSAYEQLVKIRFRSTFFDRAKADDLNIKIPTNIEKASIALHSGLKDDLNSYDYYDDLKAFIFPVLVLAGKADDIPMEELDRITQSIPNSKLVIFEQSGHFPFIEEPTKFTKTVSIFLKK